MVSNFLSCCFEFYNIYFKDYSKTDVIFMINILSCHRYYFNVLYITHSWVSLGKNFKIVHWRLTDFLCFLTHLGKNAVKNKKLLFSILHRHRDHNSEKIVMNTMIQEYEILTKAHHDFIFLLKVNTQYSYLELYTFHLHLTV